MANEPKITDKHMSLRVDVLDWMLIERRAKKDKITVTKELEKIVHDALEGDRPTRDDVLTRDRIVEENRRKRYSRRLENKH